MKRKYKKLEQGTQGWRLFVARSRLGLSRKTLAEKANISTTTISRFESGQRMLFGAGDWLVEKRLLKALGITQMDVVSNDSPLNSLQSEPQVMLSQEQYPDQTITVDGEKYILQKRFNLWTGMTIPLWEKFTKVFPMMFETHKANGHLYIKKKSLPDLFLTAIELFRENVKLRERIENDHSKLQHPRIK